MRNPEDKDPDFQEENNLQVTPEPQENAPEEPQQPHEQSAENQAQLADEQSHNPDLNQSNSDANEPEHLNQESQENAPQEAAEAINEPENEQNAHQTDEPSPTHQSQEIASTELQEPQPSHTLEQQSAGVANDAATTQKTEEQGQQFFESAAQLHSEAEQEQHLDESESQPDYSHLSKEELVDLAEKQVINPEYAAAEAIIQKIKPIYENIKQAERLSALETFVAGGNDEQDFEFKADALTERFEAATRAVKERRKKLQADQEKQKTANLAEKVALIERLTKLVEAEEHKNSRDELKKIQDSWKAIGPVPLKDAENLWNTYNHLVNKYYNNNTIFNQLKDLDRKKNLEAKLDICQRAENLVAETSINKSLKELNELHEEFRALGPVPKEDQEIIWNRFKVASDAIYNRRREYIEAQQGTQAENEREKLHLIERLDPFLEFKSLRIDDWNAKSKELLALQQEWKKTGPAPKNRNAELSRVFWNSYKQFFSNKSVFFKQLADEKQANLDRKTALIQEAESLSESSDWNATAARLKELQELWKTIGPVPFKSKNGSYEQFKSAIDKFFDNRRGQMDGVDKEFKENMDKKFIICQKLEDHAKNKTGSLAELDALTDEFYSIGHVPGRNLNALRKRFADAVAGFVDSSEQIEAGDKARSKAMMAMSGGEKRVPKNNAQAPKLQDWAIKKNISQQENEIETLKTNMDFLSASKNGQALRKQYESKVEEAQKRLDTLKEQLKVIQKNPS